MVVERQECLFFLRTFPFEGYDPVVWNDRSSELMTIPQSWFARRLLQTRLLYLVKVVTR